MSDLDDKNIVTESLILRKLDSIQQQLLLKSKPFLSIDEASAYLNLSKATIYGYSSKSILPKYKVQNRKIYFRLDDLNNFVLNNANRFKSNFEIESEAATRLITGR